MGSLLGGKIKQIFLPCVCARVAMEITSEEKVRISGRLCRGEEPRARLLKILSSKQQQREALPAGFGYAGDDEGRGKSRRRS
jgi:hypothetical protein